MIEAIEAAYQVYSQEVSSKIWMSIPIFVLAFAIAIPPMLSMNNKITDEKMRTYTKYIAIMFFVYIAIGAVVMAESMSGFVEVEELVYEHVESLDCSGKLDYIKSILLDQPDYMTENLKNYIENDFYQNCSGDDFTS